MNQNIEAIKKAVRYQAEYLRAGNPLRETLICAQHLDGALAWLDMPPKDYKPKTPVASKAA